MGGVQGGSSGGVGRRGVGGGLEAQVFAYKWALNQYTCRIEATCRIDMA